MAKAPKSTPVGDGIDKEFLKSLVAMIGTDQVGYVSQVQGQSMLAHNPPLIEVNTAMLDANGNAACRALPAAVDYLAANTGGEAAPASNYAVISNAALPPPKKRGNTEGSGAPTKYPFATLEVGQSFFSPNSEHKKLDAVKGLGSTVSAQNDKYSEPTGEVKTVTRAVRDKVTKKAQLGPDGKKVTETVELPVKKYNRKFTIRPVVGGQKYGEWTAPADGALIARTV